MAKQTRAQGSFHFRILPFPFNAQRASRIASPQWHLGPSEPASNTKPSRLHMRGSVRGDMSTPMVDPPTKASVPPRHPRWSCSLWSAFVYMTTCCFPPFCLRRCGRMPDVRVQHAWREKMALLLLIVILCGLLAFFTFGLQTTICERTTSDRSPLSVSPSPEAWVIRGWWYAIPEEYLRSKHTPSTMRYIEKYRDLGYRDITPLFANSIPTPACDRFGVQNISLPLQECNVLGGMSYCHRISWWEIARTRMNVAVSYEWEDVAATGVSSRNAPALVVYNGIVLDLAPVLQTASNFTAPTTLPTTLPASLERILRPNLGKDITRQVLVRPEVAAFMPCLIERYQVGFVSRQTSGCFASYVISIVTLVIIIGFVLIRVAMAIVHSTIVAPRLCKASPFPPSQAPCPPGKPLPASDNEVLRAQSFLRKSRYSSKNHGTVQRHHPTMRRQRAAAAVRSSAELEFPFYTVIQVTCYSEGEASIRTTLESIAETDYEDSRKLIFLIADGLVTGSGNTKSTPEICVDLISMDGEDVDPPALSYVAVADGTKQHNMAKVYCGYFCHKQRSVPTLLIVKCGAPAERHDRKPGNRGKRDSQVILMSFFSKVMFNDRMSPLDYDIFVKIQKVARVSPDLYQTVLMVDADTKIMPPSIRLMANAMRNDPSIMGLCGETQIANKRQSWVTAIQVYEYFISHHLSKNFESLFGGVTCLPGCFSMFRIKAPKQRDGEVWTPILANPDIIEEFSQNVVETLHKKNLLSLGEDRYLTTLMLKTFPKRHTRFIPQARCKTVVPDEFRVLLSQRRRWINSTIHNLMELVLVKDLCGTFCFSMQFVVAMDLLSTVVLPAAIFFTFVLIYAIATPASSFLQDSLLPLLMLLTILVLPSLMVLVTARSPVYFLWMLIYLLALPLWNFVLPVYAFWHFDDFTWGKTRTLTGSGGAGKGMDEDSHGWKEGTFDSFIPMRRWQEWERERRVESLRQEYRQRDREAIEEAAKVKVVVVDSQPVSPPPPGSSSSINTDTSSSTPSSAYWTTRREPVRPPPPRNESRME